MSGDAPITNCTELRIGSLQGRSSLHPCRRNACPYIAATVRLTSPSLGVHTQDIPDIMTGCRHRRFLAEIVTGSHGSHGTAQHATGGGFPDVRQLLLGTLMNYACTP